MNLKKLWLFAFLGLVTATIGVFIAAFAGNFLSGMDHGAAVVLGMGMYLCVVVVICTGVIVAKLEETAQNRDK